jgi:hypothetical protein
MQNVEHHKDNKMILSANQVLEHGLDYLHLKSDRWSNDRKVLEFHAHHG